MTMTAENPVMTIKEQKFNFSYGITYVLTNGECWNLAGALKARTNFPIIAFYGDNEMQHVGIELPNGLICDIEGISTRDQWFHRWAMALTTYKTFHIGDIDPEDDMFYDCLADYDNSVEDELYFEMTLGEIADNIAERIGLS